MTDPRERLETDLAAIRAAIAAGQLEEARTMIAGVALNAPSHSEWSKQIGELYLELGFPCMAGRYWYLLQDQSDQMIDACKEFERSLANNPVLILNAIGWVENPDWVENPSPHAKATMLDVHNKATVLRQKYQYPCGPGTKWGNRLVLLGCGLVGFMLLFIFFLGILFISQLISPWFFGGPAGLATATLAAVCTPSRPRLAALSSFATTDRRPTRIIQPRDNCPRFSR